MQLLWHQNWRTFLSKHKQCTYLIHTQVLTIVIMATDLVNNDQTQQLDDTQSPGFHFVSNFQSMHELHKKLMLLDYWKEFCLEYKCKPIHRYYFAVQTNPGEQFYIFSCLCAWLIKSKCKLITTDSEQELNPQEFEDPNVTIAAILDYTRRLGENINFPPNRLKSGFGVEVIWVLNRFTEDAIVKTIEEKLKRTNLITVKGLLGKSEGGLGSRGGGGGEEEDGDEEDEDGRGTDDLEMSFEDQYTLVEDARNADEEEEEEDYVQDGNDAGMIRDESGERGRKMDSQDDKPKGFLHSNTDSEAWKLEIERVLPQLKVVLRSTDHKGDWRLHLTQMHANRKEIQSHFESTQLSLEKLTNETRKSMEKISSREKYLHLQLEPLINEYLSLTGHLLQINDNYKSVSSGVTNKSRQLATITEELDSIKSEMEERGSSMTDGTPLVSLRKALNRVKSEISSIDIRIGVAVNTLLGVKAAERTQETLERQKTPLALNKTTGLQKLVF